MSRIALLNTEIDNLSFSEALQKANELVQQRIPSYIVTPNVDHIVRLETNLSLRKSYRDADLVLADGMPLIWLSRVRGTPIKEKVSGSDFLPSLCELCAREGYRVFFFGAKPGVADRASQNLKRKNPKLIVAGAYSPPIDFEKNEKSLSYAIDKIRCTSPDVLVVALGCPKQEIFIHENLKTIGAPLALGIGASLDFEAGEIKRAPVWMQRTGLEWFFRIIQDPKRLAKRYLIDDVKIIKVILKYRKISRRNND